MLDGVRLGGPLVLGAPASTEGCVESVIADVELVSESDASVDEFTLVAPAGVHETIELPGATAALDIGGSSTMGANACAGLSPISVD